MRNSDFINEDQAQHREDDGHDAGREAERVRVLITIVGEYHMHKVMATETDDVRRRDICRERAIAVMGIASQLGFSREEWKAEADRQGVVTSG